jgi:uncharacterized protein DUF4038/collagenase-like protein with putative collagen-binding domain
MVRSRRRCSKWLAAAALAGLAAACSSSPGSGAAADGGIVDGGTLPGFDVPPPTGLFPLGVSSDGTHLVAADGTPFLLHGEAAWSLIAQLTTAETMQYLADRHRRGVNAILVNLIEAYYSDHPPSNAAGDAPFIVNSTSIADVDFSMPREAYFAHADQVIDLAASQGIAVMLFPSYLGFQAQEGWRDQLSKMGATASAPKCASYGRFVGQRYAGKNNIVWMWGGDYDPSSDPAVETCMRAISDGIRAASPGALTSAHWSPNTISRTEAEFNESIKLVGVYHYPDDLQDTCQRERTDSPRMPTYLIETCYENETIQGCNSKPFEARRRQFWGWLGCGAGQIYGIGGMWQFSSGWQAKLGSPVSMSASRLFAIAQQVSWQTLAPDAALVTAGGGSPGSADGVIATRTADHKQAVIYLPPTGGTSTITVDLTRLGGSVTATWQDPTADHSVAAEEKPAGSHMFKTPGLNTGGDPDWVLVLTAP